MTKKTAIILINWNSFNCTYDCIASLKAMPYLDYDIILVDNGSKDGSGEKLLSIFPDLIYLKIENNVGFTGSNNVALNYSINRDYTYTLLLNNDTFVEPSFLEILVKYLDENEDVGAVQPKIYFNHDRTLLWNGGSYFNKWTGNTIINGSLKKTGKRTESIKYVDWITGCALLTKNDIIKNIGLLDESLFMYYDDLDFSFRIREAGHLLVYHPESVIYHIAGAAYKTGEKGKEGNVNPIVRYCTTRNRIWLIKKYLNPVHRLTAGICSFFYFFSMLTYFLIRLRFVKLKMVARGIADGLSGKMTTQYQFDKNI